MEGEDPPSSVRLEVVNEAFGPYSDLYSDVLQVQPNATSKQIKNSYFDRRNDLFQLLADFDNDEQDSITESHRKHAERKLDAVVCAVRILGDPELRLQYDDMRASRLRKKLKGSRQQSKRSPDRSSKEGKESFGPDDENVNNKSSPNRAQKMMKRSPNRSKKDKGSLRRSKGGKGSPVSKASSTSSTSQSSGVSSKYSPSLPGLNSTPISEISARNFDEEEEETNLVSCSMPAEPQKRSHRISTRKKAAASRTKVSPEESVLSQSTKRSTVTDGDESVSVGSATMISDDEEGTIFTIDSRAEAVLAKTAVKPKGMFDRIRMEVIGAVDDTTRSFEQVLNVFTLQEEDIQAVMGRIDKAKRQISRGTVVEQPRAAATKAKPRTKSSRKARR